MKDNVETILEKTWPLCEPYARATNPDFRLGIKEVFNEELFVKSPVASVLVLAWRHEKFIEECISSICNQVTDFPFEVLVGEDASPDGTLSACLELQKRYPRYVKIIYSEKNVGLVGNMVRLDDRARGDYIAICEGDDYWVDPQKLNKQVALLRAREDVSLVHMAVWQQYEKCKWSRCPAAHKTIRRVLNTNDLLASQQRRLMFLGGNYIQTPTVMCRKIAFTKACESLMAVERVTRWIPSSDFMLWFFTMQHGKSYFVPDIVAVKRINGTSLTSITDDRIVNARILGDRRNALTMAVGDGFCEEDVCTIISKIETATARCNSMTKRRANKVGPFYLLIKRFVIWIAGV